MRTLDRSLRLAIVGGLIATLSVAAQEEKATPKSATSEPGIRIELESDGLPGGKKVGEERETTRQTILAAPGRLVLRDHKTGTRYLFRLDKDPAEFWELSPNGAEYRDAARLGKTQRDRDIFERQSIELMKQESPEEFQAYLKKEHLREDGKRVVRSELSPNPLPEKVLGHPVKKLQVWENDRLIVDALVTDALDIEIPFFDFYRRVGAFSEEVLAELKKIRAVPLKVSFTVVTSNLNYPIRATATEIVRENLASAVFELPPDANEIKRRAIVTCDAVDCEKPVEIAAPPDKYVILPITYYFCSKECKKKTLPLLRGQPRVSNPPRQKR